MCGTFGFSISDFGLEKGTCGNGPSDLASIAPEFARSSFNAQVNNDNTLKQHVQHRGELGVNDGQSRD